MRGPATCNAAIRTAQVIDAATCARSPQDLKRCRLRKNVGLAYGFDADGWQTFWQEDLFGE